ncbi:MAG: hypothetical protein K5764_00805 [Prevotella sp.]|nr:hypothetical protein [Prevotella sp.]
MKTRKKYISLSGTVLLALLVGPLLLFSSCSHKVMPQKPFGPTQLSIEVSSAEPYTDHLTLRRDAADMDLMVKFVFNEAENQLTVSLISYRSLFVFRESVPYKGAVKGSKLRPDRLPYVVNADPDATFKLTPEFRNTLSRPHKKHVFKRWIDYEGLQPVPTEYQMVNDYIEQTFDIVNKRDYVRVSLRDLLLMEHYGNSAKKPNRYQFVFGADLNREYMVSIRRDPCFGQEEVIAAAKAAEKSVSDGYKAIMQKFGKGHVKSEAMLDLFHESQSLLQKQFPRKDTLCACPEAQQAWDHYNAVVDSIGRMQCVVDKEEKAGGGGLGLGKAATGVKSSMLLQRARQLDEAVARWLLSTDEIERSDLKNSCERIVKTTHKNVDTDGVITPEQKQAWEIFLSAERYYKKVLGQ